METTKTLQVQHPFQSQATQCFKSRYKCKSNINKNEFLLTWIWRYLPTDILSLHTLDAVGQAK